MFDRKEEDRDLSLCLRLMTLLILALVVGHLCFCDASGWYELDLFSVARDEAVSMRVFVLRYISRNSG